MQLIQINMKSLFDKKITMITMVMACIFTCLFVIQRFSIKSYAEGIGDDYMQVIYNQENGLGSNEISCIYQTDSGYIWIGTESGLYRYNGSDFKLYSLWDTDKDDVYFINSLFQDSKGRLWVGTDNYGLFYLDGINIIHFTDDYYNGVKAINDVCEAADGTIYVATAYGLYSYNGFGNTLTLVEDLAKQNVLGVTRVEDKVWGISNGNTIFSMNKDKKITQKKSTSYTKEDLSTISSDDLGRIYIGTVGNDILSFSGWKSVKVLNSAFDGINDIKIINNMIYICTDNGVGYLGSDGSFIPLAGLDINSYITSMLVDYEGNYWFASKRTGVLYMSRSKFSYLNNQYHLSESMTNAVYSAHDNLYIGTDDGLTIIDPNGGVVSNELTEYLNGTSVRDIKEDSVGNMWIATYRRYGVLKVTPSGKISNISRSKGLSSNFINCLTVLNNDDIAVGTEEGINLINPSGKIYKTFDYNSGLEYPNITCIIQSEDGTIYAGSDGGGLYIINDEKIRRYDESDGITSDVVTTLQMGKNGLWIGTNNGLSFYSETFRAISNIDFSNNISSILINGDDLYIIGSKGLLKTNEDELLGTAPITNRYYSSGDGIYSSVTLGSKNICFNDKIYICTGKGVISFDTRNVFINKTEPKIIVTDVDIDGKTLHFSQTSDSINVPSDAQRVEISFAVFSFCNRDNIQITYQLQGFDNEPQVLSGTDNLVAVYTNLDGGDYVLDVSASNGDGAKSANTLSFAINKQYKFYEYKLFRYLVSFLVLLFILLAISVVFNLRLKFLGKNREFEDLTRVHEDALKSSTAKTDYLANMSNEIKIPINAMISKANSMIREGSVDTETAGELKTIIEKGNDVLGKVDETILLARLESGAEEIIEEPYSITTLICDLSDNMLNKLSELPIKFVVDLGEKIPDILIGDFDKIKTILDIILANAIKYTKEGSITLSVDSYEMSDDNELQPVNLIFSISDTGTGISEDRISHLFEIYYENESKKSASNTGNGISLSIAKKIVDLMDGDIEVDSTPGAGSTFTVSIMQTRPAQSAHNLPMNEKTIERVSREEAERMWAPDLKVLLVDDMEISRNVALDIISGMDVKCDTASDGPGAIDMVMSNDYDIVFMDIAMPVMNGIDTLKEIRELSDSKYQELPVIAMTEDAIGKNRQDIIDEGFSDIVLKPFDLTIFAGLVMRFVDNSKIKYRSNDNMEYMSDSRYSVGLKKLEEFFDVATVLERIGGNIEVYNRILLTFYNQNIDSVQELKQRYQRDLRGFRNKIHIIRNGCQSIGAMEASEIAFRIEKAVNKGNRAYIENNLPMMFDCITVINQCIREYLDFVDEEKAHEKESVDTKIEPVKAEISETADYDEPVEGASETGEANIINIDTLRTMREATYLEDMSVISKLYAEISKGEYGADDRDFLNVLGESIEKKDFVEINDLLGTYISLKSSL